MSHHSGLNRRSFLRAAGSTALAGVAGMGPAAAAAAGRAAPDLPDRKFDFDTPYSRIGSDCTKWDEQIRVYGRASIDAGMGIADMDFKGAPCITKALLDRIQHENHGYLTLPPSHVKSIVDWNARRYGLEIDPASIVQSPAGHPAIISVLRAFSPPGSKVLVQTPIYSGFFGDIRKLGLRAEESPLKLVAGRFAMDFEDLERRIDHDTHTIILCNPQNPTGNVWSRDDLMTLGEICTRRRVVVLADEFHCDFVAKRSRYTPFASLDNDKIVMNSITLKSASKSFNLAAMKCAYMFSRNAAYLDRVRAVHRDEINTLGMVAHRAAYTDGDSWMDQVIPYIDANQAYTEDFIRAKIPLIKFTKPQGTYLAWLDVSGVIEKIGAKQQADEANSRRAPSAPMMTPTRIVERYFVEKARVHMNAGAPFGMAAAAGMRMNVGTSRQTLELALSNLAQALEKA